MKLVDTPDSTPLDVLEVGATEKENPLANSALSAYVGFATMKWAGISVQEVCVLCVCVVCVLCVLYVVCVVCVWCVRGLCWICYNEMGWYFCTRGMTW